MIGGRDEASSFGALGPQRLASLARDQGPSAVCAAGWL